MKATSMTLEVSKNFLSKIHLEVIRMKIYAKEIGSIAVFALYDLHDLG